MRFLFICFILMVSSRAFPQRQTTQTTLNKYVKFVNQNVETLSFFHNKFEQFNLKVNHYYQTSPADSASRLRRESEGFVLSFSDNADNASLSSLYEQAVEPHEDLNPAIQEKLNTKADRLMKQIYKLLEVNTSLEKYVFSKAYIGESNLDFAYKKLNEARIIFHDFAIIKEALEADVNSLQQGSAGEYFDFWREEIIPDSRGLIYGIKKDLPKESLSFAQSIEKKLEKLRDIKKQLKSLKKESKAQYKLVLSAYQQLEDAVGLINQVNSDFASTELLGAEEKLFGKAYVQFNKSALPKYNQLIALYNELGQEVNPSTMFAMKEVPWFKFLPAKAQIVQPERKTDLADAKPNHLVFLLDVSGSMEASNKLPLLQKSLKYLVSQMREYDKLSIVTYSGNARIELEAADINDQKRIFKAIDHLKSNGKTNALAGLQMAYSLLDKYFIRDGNNKVIMATDGYFSRDETFLKLVSKEAFLEKRLSVFYFGSQPLRYEQNLTELSQTGKGNYVHVKKDNAMEVLIQEARSNLVD